MNEKKIFLCQQFFILLLTFIILILIFPVAGALDLHLIAPWISSDGQFYLRNDWFLAQLNHRWVKNVVIAVYVIVLVRWFGAFYVKKWHILRKQDGYFLLLVLLGCGLIGLLKSQSGHACPWNMIQPTVNGYMWNFHLKHGHCFPGGHASTGFALMAGFFVYRISQPKKAYFYLFAGLILGFAFGWAQMMRGAHFLSHNLWTAWIIWAVNIVMYGLFYPFLTSSSDSEPDIGN